jgi:hypothetical protein
MHVENENNDSAASPTHDVCAETLTDVIDELKRSAFMRALERRPDADAYRRTIEATYLVRTKSS